MKPHLLLGPWQPRAWALIVTIGVAFCWVLIVPKARRRGYAPEKVLPWLVLGFPVGVLGAFAVSWVVEVLDARALLDRAGMTVLGAVLACSIFSVLYVRFVFREPVGRLLDLVAFSFPLAAAIGRIGCLFEGCCFGRIAALDAPRLFTLSVDRYHPDSAAGRFHAEHAAASQVYNLPLALGLGACVLLGLALLLERRFERLRGSGALFFGVIAADALLRLPLEMLRAGEPAVWAGLSRWQLLALAIAVPAALESARRWRGQSRARLDSGALRR